MLTIFCFGATVVVGLYEQLIQVQRPSRARVVVPFAVAAMMGLIAAFTLLGLYERSLRWLGFLYLLVGLVAVAEGVVQAVRRAQRAEAD